MQTALKGLLVILLLSLVCGCATPRSNTRVYKKNPKEKTILTFKKLDEDMKIIGSDIVVNLVTQGAKSLLAREGKKGEAEISAAINITMATPSLFVFARFVQAEEDIEEVKNIWIANDKPLKSLSTFNDVFRDELSLKIADALGNHGVSGINVNKYMDDIKNELEIEDGRNNKHVLQFLAVGLLSPFSETKIVTNTTTVTNSTTITNTTKITNDKEVAEPETKTLKSETEVKLKTEKSVDENLFKVQLVAYAYPALVAKNKQFGIPWTKYHQTKSTLTVNITGPGGDANYGGSAYTTGDIKIPISWDRDIAKKHADPTEDNLIENWKVLQPQKTAPVFRAPISKEGCTLSIKLSEASSYEVLWKMAADKVGDIKYSDISE